MAVAVVAGAPAVLGGEEVGAVEVLTQKAKALWQAIIKQDRFLRCGQFWTLTVLFENSNVYDA